MKKSKKWRIASFVMALLLAVGSLPFANVAEVKAAEDDGTKTVVFDAEVELAALAKSTEIAEGTQYVDKFFTTIGKTKRANMDAFALDIGKTDAAGLSFEIPEGYTAAITVSARGAGSGKTAGATLNGETKSFDASTVGDQVWEDLAAGSYTIVSADPEGKTGGTRITKITVDMQKVNNGGGSAETKDVIFDAAVELAALGKSAAIDEGTKYTDGFFTTIGSTKRANMDVFALDIGKTDAAGVVFEIPAGSTATVVVSARGGGSGKTAGVTLNGETKTFDGSTVGDQEWTDLAAGEYKLVSANPDGTSGGSRITKIAVSIKTAAGPVLEPKTATFDAAVELAALGKSAAVDEGTKYTDGFFTTIGSTKRANMDVFALDIGKTDAAGVAFEVPAGYTATVVVSARGGGSGKTAGVILNGETKTFDGSTVGDQEWSGLAAGSYTLVSTNPDGTSGGTRITKIVVNMTAASGAPEKKDVDWADVAAPSIESAVVKGGNIDVVAKANVKSHTGADQATIIMTDAKGNETKKDFVTSGQSFTHSFTPSATGTYKIRVEISRKNETTVKASEETTVEFVLPLATPSITSATSKGNGVVEVDFDSVAEATSYDVCVGEEVKATVKDNGSSKYTAKLTGLAVGTTAAIKVVAVRGEDKNASDVREVEVTADEQHKWSFAAYGSSVDTKNNGFIGDANKGEVTVYSEGGKGKIVPGSTDGLAFYYTTVPANKYANLSGKIHVDSWTLSNGQDGFGLMVSDAVGKHGDGTAFWTNAIQVIASKIEYYHDGASVTTDSNAAKISMKLGIGINAKTGIVAQDVKDITAGKITMPPNFVTVSKTLETSGAEFGAGTYNIIGNATKDEGLGTLANPVTDMTFSLESIFSDGEYGYVCTYKDMDGNVVGTETMMVGANDMTDIDADNKYIGFFASRNARITVSDIQLEVKDAAREIVIEDTYVVPNYKITSASTSNSADYTITFKSDVDGNVYIVDEDGNTLYGQEFKKDVTCKFPVVLKPGMNRFSVVSTPVAGYRPTRHEVLTSYDTVYQMFNVNYQTFDSDVLYVSPIGYSKNEGTKNSPLDIHTALAYAKPGQTIYLMEGVYFLNSTAKVPRGIDGTAEQRITLMPDPESTTRPVFNCQQLCEGLVFGGNYWDISGFDVCYSANSKDGARLCGNYNVIKDCNFYHNGNTGLQISALNNSNDDREDWPSYNLVLNCTSHNNADLGYEDADGFAAKLTCGDGNVFDGCIAYNNADDGWDLFAKVQTGSIGAVTIQNCVAFGNGYLQDGTNAGNGNGFKMGGDSMAGGHKLINSIAFDNKAKGIDSNSCPDNKVTNCVSFNNESYNVALYTNTAVNTDYEANGIISYRTVKLDQGETFKLKGTQDATKVYNSTNYFWNCTEAGTNNANGIVKDDWFVSLDTKYDYKNHVYSELPITRNADGSVNRNGLLELTEKGKAALATHVANFIDTDAAKWYADGIKFVNDNKIMTGYDDGTNRFGTFDAISRGQVAVILYRMSGSPEVTVSGKFSDVAAGKYYEKAVEWCASKGIVTGYAGTTKFGPNDAVTRQDLAVMLYRYAKATGKATSAAADISKFEDVSAVSAYAKAAFEYCVGAGVITGKNGKTLDPKGPATRAEVATMIARFVGPTATPQ